MSLEGRMSMPTPQSEQPKPSAAFEHAKLFNGAAQEHSPGKEFEEVQARKLLEGLTTPEELAVKFGPKVMDEVMKTTERISAYESFSGNEYKPELVVPQEPTPAPHPLVAVIPSVIEHYMNPDRTEDDEQEYLDLLNELKKNDREFANILSQYSDLIKLYPDRTEEYEMKAMKDFVEYNARLRK